MLGFPDPPPTLANERAALRLAAERDIPEVLIAHQDDRALAGALGRGRPPSGAELGRRVEAEADQRAAGAGVWFTITAVGSEECVGQVETTAVDVDHRRAGMQLWIAPRQRGCGFGAAGLTLAARWLLTDGDLARVSLLAPPANAALRATALRAGFTAEGVLRGYALGAAGRTDAEVYSLLAADLVR